MDIIVCVKHVPDVTGAEISIKDNKIVTDDLPFEINEWDEYAIEEAILIKEKNGGSGTVTAITIGDEEAEATLRRCLAKGADKAIRVHDDAFEGSDAYAIAKILYNTIKDMPFDLVFTGLQTNDEGYGQVGGILSEFLEIPHASLVKKIEIKDKLIEVNRELEGGLEEVLELQLPALLTIQTGINEPRYVSIMGIRKAKKKELQVMGLQELELNPDEVGISGSWLQIEELSIPKPTKEVIILDDATKIAEILRARGLI
ncbi:MAG: electron transfer flavoprotein subunit beta/FixA family protein [Candidatus Sifarchaeia archaeon]